MNNHSHYPSAPLDSHLLLIDASPYIFRSYFALPSSLRTPTGAPINAVQGFASFLIKLFSEEAPSHVAIAFDGSLTTSFRNEIYPDYKANRDRPPAELVAQLDTCKEVAAALGATTAISNRFEADDLLGSWLAQLSPLPPQLRVSVVTSDKDLAQLITDPCIQLYDFARGNRWTAQTVEEKFGVRPEQLIDFLALAGDSVDNIPGVPGIGAKTAVALLRSYQDLNSLLNNVKEVHCLPIRGAASIQKKLVEHAASARMSQRLAKIASDASVPSDLKDLRWRGPAHRWGSLCDNLGFSSLRVRGEALAAVAMGD